MPRKVARKVAVPKKPKGRPPKYMPEYDARARDMCFVGATDKELAEAFAVSETTIQTWKSAHPSFLASIKKGREVADARVAKALYRRALGYEHDAVKIITVADGNNSGSHVEEVPYVERYPPDTTAAIFWLKNRQKEHWRDKHEVEHSADKSFADTLRAARERAANR